MTKLDNTIVTACDSRYFWGTLLLVLSIRKEGSRLPIHVLHGDLDAREISLLEQLDDVHCISARASHAMFQKPEALLSAETTWVTWLDSDVIWRGDLTSLLSCDAPGIQIRVRKPQENADAFALGRKALGGIPSPILTRWRDDVGEREQPRFDCMAVSNAIALHRDFRWLPARWHALMERVSLNPAQLVDRGNVAYQITDEATLTALLMFTHTEVPLLPYQLDQDMSRVLIHFAGSPKPWQGWQHRYMKHYKAVSAVVQWASEAGLQMPPIPDAMRPERENHFLWRARLSAFKNHARSQIAAKIRRMRSSS